MWISQAKNRCYYHLTHKFFIENDVIDLLKQMKTEAEDAKFIEILLVSFIGKAKIKIEEMDENAPDLIRGMYFACSATDFVFFMWHLTVIFSLQPFSRFERVRMSAASRMLTTTSRPGSSRWKNISQNNGLPKHVKITAFLLNVPEFVRMK